MEEKEKLEAVATAFVQACVGPQAKQRGTVRWFATGGKSYGFITPENGDHDVFAHYTNIIDQPYPKMLHEGQLVEFDIEVTEKGPIARRIKVVKG